MKPYYASEGVELYHGDFREVLADLDKSADLVIADPPYGETSLSWDTWPDGWPAFMATVASSMWCFGSMRTLLSRYAELADYWRLSQDIVWEKPNGSGAAKDRFNRVHELALHLYRGPWREVYHEPPRVHVGVDPRSRKAGTKVGPPTPRHRGAYGNGRWVDDGTRISRSVIKASVNRRATINETQKPVELLEQLVGYGCPPTGLVVDPFAGSGSTLVAARNAGRRAIGVEVREEQCEATANRLTQDVLNFGSAS